MSGRCRAGHAPARAARRCAALEADFAARHARDAGDEIENRALAGRIRADQAENFSGIHGEVDVVDRNETAELLAHRRTSSRAEPDAASHAAATDRHRLAGVLVAIAGGAREPAAGRNGQSPSRAVCSSTISRMPKRWFEISFGAEQLGNTVCRCPG